MTYNYTLMIMIVVISTVVARSKVPDPPIFASPKTYPSICYLPPDSALCDTSENSSEIELLTRYYFDTTTEECYPFGIQKCGGNQNQFQTKTECLNYCKTPKN